MNKYRLVMAGINLTDALERFGGNYEMYEGFLREFPDDRNYENLIEAISKGEVQVAFSAAHALKGIAGNLSMSELYESIFPLVEKLRAGSMEDIDELVADVSQKYMNIRDAIVSMM